MKIRRTHAAGTLAVAAIAGAFLYAQNQEKKPQPETRQTATPHPVASPATGAEQQPGLPAEAGPPPANMPISPEEQPPPPGSMEPGATPGTIDGQPDVTLGAAPRPAAGAPDLGGVYGAGATPNPGGIHEPYAPPGPEQYLFAAAPDANRGKLLVIKYGCGQCHTIGPLREARGRVGPPLNGIATRVYIAGVLQNSLANRARWIENPQAFVPKVVMPNMGLTRTDAMDISAFLDSLR